MPIRLFLAEGANAITDSGTLSRRLAEYRESRGLSRAKLGRMLGVSGCMVWTWEAGRKVPTLTNLERIDRLLARVDQSGSDEPETSCGP